MHVYKHSTKHQITKNFGYGKSLTYSTGHRQRQNETRLLPHQTRLLGVVFSLSLETRRKSLLVPKALILYTHG